MSPAEAAEVPEEVVTVTSTVPEPAGEVAVQAVVDEHDTPVAAVLPKATVVPAVVKFVPVMETWVPPAAGPELGEMEVTVGVVDGDWVPTTMLPAVSPATHRVVDGQEIDVSWFRLSTVVLVHADAPPVGFVDVRMLPAELPPTHSLIDGQEIVLV